MSKDQETPRGSRMQAALIAELRKQIRAIEQQESLQLEAQIEQLTGASQAEFAALVTQFETFLKTEFIPNRTCVEAKTLNNRYLAFTKQLATSNPTPEIFHLFIKFAAQVFHDLEWELPCPD